MWYDLKMVLSTLMTMTGIAVWALVLAYVIVYLLIYKLLYLGFGSSLSMHRWFLRTGQMQATADFYWSLFLGSFHMYGDKCMTYHMVSLNGGYWRNMWDYADSRQHRIDRGDVEEVEDNGFGEGIAAAV